MSGYRQSNPWEKKEWDGVRAGGSDGQGSQLTETAAKRSSSHKRPFVQPSAGMFSSNTEAVVTEASCAAHGSPAAKARRTQPTFPSCGLALSQRICGLGAQQSGEPSGPGWGGLWRLDLVWQPQKCGKGPYFLKASTLKLGVGCPQRWW